MSRKKISENIDNKYLLPNSVCESTMGKMFSKTQVSTIQINKRLSAGIEITQVQVNFVDS